MPRNFGRAGRQQEETINVEAAVESALGGDYETMVKKAEEIGRKLKEQGLSTSQIRNVFGSIKKMEMRLSDEDFNIKRAALLKPRIAYAEKRHGREKIGLIRKVIDAGIDGILRENNQKKRKDKFKYFCEFFEAILAYHRAFGGK